MIRKLKLNQDIGQYKQGSVVRVNCDNTGIPLDREWRRRVRDSHLDNCVEWVEDRPKAKKGDKS